MPVQMNLFPDYAVSFLDYLLTAQGRSAKTVDAYALDLRTFFRYLKVIRLELIPPPKSPDDWESLHDFTDITITHIRSIDLADLYGYMSWLTREQHNSATTRARKVASLKSFYKYLFLKARLLDVNPAAELDSPKVVKRLPKYLNLDDSEALLDQVENNDENKHRERDYAILTLFMNCGMRLAELVGINLTSIRGDTLQVIGKGNKERTVYLNEACLDAVRDYLTVRPVEGVRDKKALFLSERGNRISPKTVQYLVKKHLGQAGLDAARYSTHKLRHTAATLMYKHGHVDIRALQAILGHESIATTEIYTHVDDQQLREAIRSNPLGRRRSGDAFPPKTK